MSDGAQVIELAPRIRASLELAEIRRRVEACGADTRSGVIVVQSAVIETLLRGGAALAREGEVMSLWTGIEEAARELLSLVDECAAEADGGAR